MIQNNDISSLTVKNATAVGIATVVPSRFFSYAGISTAIVSGVVQTKLVGPNRRLAVASAQVVRVGGSSKPSYDKVSHKAEPDRMMRGENIAPPGNNNEASSFSLDIPMESKNAGISYVTSTQHNSGINTMPRAVAVAMGAIVFAIFW